MLSEKKLALPAARDTKMLTSAASCGKPSCGVLMVEGTLRLGDMENFLRGVWLTSCEERECRRELGLGLLGAVADLELPMAGSW